MSTNHPFTGVHDLALLIDHTLLKPEATETDIVTVCEQALEHGFASVCVNPTWVPLVWSYLGSKVKTCSVVGFPLGANDSDTKLAETDLALAEGATEIDVVINVGRLRSGASQAVGEEIEHLATHAHAAGGILKVILETCLLTDDQKVEVCKLAKEAGADFVKTSTGFSTSGATEADVALMRATVGPDMGVKASGGVRTLDALTRMVQAGANRIGTSSGVQILAQYHSGTPVANAGVGGTY